MKMERVREGKEIFGAFARHGGAKNNPLPCRFFLHAAATLVFFDCELASPQRESEFRSEDDSKN